MQMVQAAAYGARELSLLRSTGLRLWVSVDRATRCVPTYQAGQGIPPTTWAEDGHAFRNVMTSG